MFKVYLLKQVALAPDPDLSIRKKPYELRGQYGNLKQATLSLKKDLATRFADHWFEDGTFGELPLFAFKAAVNAPSCYVPGLIIQDGTTASNLPKVVEKPKRKPAPPKPPQWVNMDEYWELKAERFPYYAFVDLECADNFYYSVEFEAIVIGKGYATTVELAKARVMETIERHRGGK